VTDGYSRLPRHPTLAARKLPLHCGSCRGATFGSNWTKKRTQSLSDIQLSGSSAILALDVRSSGPPARSDRRLVGAPRLRKLPNYNRRHLIENARLTGSFSDIGWTCIDLMRGSSVDIERYDLAGGANLSMTYPRVGAPISR
jgi:hypothetical protein